MHEMAIVQSVLDVAFREAEKNASPEVTKIKLQIGELSGVVRDSLEFAFSVLKEETPAASAELEIETIKLAAECGRCGAAECAASDLNLICAGCGGTLRIVAGREMRVEYIDLA
jgi:hydrogenase nickel incorporation protein HypA/HybF